MIAASTEGAMGYLILGKTPHFPVTWGAMNIWKTLCKLMVEEGSM